MRKRGPSGASAREGGDSSPDDLGALRVIRAFAREDDEHRRFMTASRRSLAAGRRLYTPQPIYRVQAARGAEQVSHP